MKIQPEQLAAAFKALSDANRLAIFELIRERCSGAECEITADDAGNTVSEIAAEFALSLSTVSHHIRELKNAGLIRIQKRGQWVYCATNEDVLKELGTFLAR